MFDLDPQVSPDNQGQVTQAGIERPDHFRGRALLWPEHERRASLAGEWVIHVAGGRDLSVGDVCIEAGEVYRVYARQFGAAEADLAAVFVLEAYTECLRSADAAVVCGTAADPQYQTPTPGVQGVLDEFACPIRCCHHGVPGVRGYQGQAGRSSHLDDSGRAVAENAKERWNSIAEGAGRGGLNGPAAGGLHECFHGTLASVREGNEDGLDTRNGAADASLNGFCSLRWRKTSFE